MGKRKNVFSLTQYGEDGEVTGSCMMLTIHSEDDNIKPYNILLDYGLIQNDTIPIEKRYKINKNKEYVPLSKVDTIICGHSNFDHISALPVCAKYDEFGEQLYNGKIIMTELASELTAHILRDGAKIMEKEVDKYNQNKKPTDPKLYPLYTKEDTETVIGMIRGYSYNKKIWLRDDIYVELLPSGHIAGACLIYITYVGEYSNKHFMYCPDMYIGDKPRPFTKQIEQKCYKSQLLVLEGTYGSKPNHPNVNAIDFLEEVILDVCVNNNQILWIPCFSMQRSTQICYLLNEIVKRNQVIADKNIPIYSCGKLTKLCHETIGKEKYAEFFDEEWTLDRSIFDNPKIQALTEKQDIEHFVLNNNLKIVLSSSGAITNGYSSLIADSFIANKKVNILGCGYIFPESTLDKIIKGQKRVEHNGSGHTVRCKFKGIIPSLSGHVDLENNVKWAKSFNQRILKKVVITHCSDDAGENLKQVLEKELKNAEVIYPKHGEVIKC